MSTKIYKAYKLNRSEDLWPLVRDVRKKGVEAVVEVLTALHQSLPIDVMSTEYKNAIARGMSDKRARLSVAATRIREGYRNQLIDPYRNEFNFDVSLTFREYDGQLYLIPYCDMLVSHALDFLDSDSRLSSFAYWNNSDRPDEVSESEWDERYRVWEAIYQAGWDNYLVLEVVCKDNFYIINPYYKLMNALVTEERQDG